MPPIDFITAFGRLLRDGSLRDAYAAHPVQAVESLNLRSCDRSAMLGLNPWDLEFQAQVLLRKRFEALSNLIPQTCCNLGADAWPVFSRYARVSFLEGDHVTVLDACHFLEYLQQKYSSAISGSEKNRVRFARGSWRFSVHFVSRVMVRDRPRRCLQFLIRINSAHWKEFVVYFAF